MGATQLTLFPEPRPWGADQRRRSRPARAPADGRGRHDDSLAAHGDDRLQRALTGRRAEIVAWLREHGPATDREIVTGLYYEGADMNLVRPRVTELLDARAVEEVDRVRDQATGMMVRRVAATGGAS